MKKRFCVVGALALAAAAAMAGCAPKGGSGKGVDISYWNLLTGADGTVMRQMVASFNEEYKDKIYVTEQYASEDVYYENLELNIPIGRGPDVAIMHSYRVQSYANQGLIYPLNSLIESEGIDMTDYPEQIVSSLGYKDETYAVPFDMHPLGIYYNKTLLAQYGCKVPTNRTELIECAKKADNTDGGVWGLPIAAGWPSDYTFTTALYQFGGVEVKNGDQPGFNTEAGVNALKSVTDLIHEHRLSPPNLGNDQDLMQFRNGRALFHINGVWMLNNLKTSNIDYGVIPLSNMFNESSSTIAVRAHTFVLPTKRKIDEEKQKAAMEFISYMSKHSDVWATAGQIPASAKARSSESYQNLAFVHDFGAVENFAIGVSSPYYFEAYTPVYSRLTAAMQTKSDDLAAMLADAETEGVKLVKEAKELIEG